MRASLVAVALIAACRGSPQQPDCPEPLTAHLTAAPSSSPYDSLFSAAGAEFGVPAELLRAIGWVETRWQMVAGSEEFPGRPAAFGVMALRGMHLERGAVLLGVPVETARRDPRANIRAAAALLRDLAAGTGDWTRAAAELSGIDLPAGRAAYLRAVERARGGPAAAAAVEPCPPDDPGPDFAAAVWRPSPNVNQRPSDATGALHLVIIHTCEGNYAGCWSWLVNTVSEVSAHYVINEDGSEISQLVREPERAWHIAAIYDCSLNRQHDCWLDGVQSNHFTVGIEHAGFASQSSFPATQLDRSAALVCDVTRDRGMPRDWQHIVAHGQLQPENRVDPGPNWPWISYVHRIQAACGEIVVDDSARYNDPGVAAASVPGDWATTSPTPDYYGGGYSWASTLPGATDSAVFSFRLDQAGGRAVEARWTSGANRSRAARYMVIDATGAVLGMATVDQTTGGGTWHALGVWTFPAGWNRVALVRDATAGSIVVADAIRVRAP